MSDHHKGGKSSEKKYIYCIFTCIEVCRFQKCKKTSLTWLDPRFSLHPLHQLLYPFCLSDFEEYDQNHSNKQTKICLTYLPFWALRIIKKSLTYLPLGALRIIKKKFARGFATPPCQPVTSRPKFAWPTYPYERYVLSKKAWPTYP